MKMKIKTRIKLKMKIKMKKKMKNENENENENEYSNNKINDWKNDKLANENENNENNLKDFDIKNESIDKNLLNDSLKNNNAISLDTKNVDQNKNHEFRVFEKVDKIEINDNIINENIDNENVNYNINIDNDNIDKKDVELSKSKKEVISSFNSDNDSNESISNKKNSNRSKKSKIIFDDSDSDDEEFEEFQKKKVANLDEDGDDDSDDNSDDNDEIENEDVTDNVVSKKKKRVIFDNSDDQNEQSNDKEKDENDTDENEENKGGKSFLLPDISSSEGENEEEDDEENEKEKETEKKKLKHSEEFVYDFDLMMQKKKEQNSNRKRKNIDLINDSDDIIADLIQQMKQAADEDFELNRERKAATRKMKLLPLVQTQLRKIDLREAFLDSGVLNVITDWLAPLPDRSLPNLQVREAMLKILLDFNIMDVERLKSSGIGKAVMYLFKNPKEIKENKKKAGKLISNWSRPIFSYDTDYQTISKEDREQRDFEHMNKINKRLKVDESSSSTRIHDLSFNLKPGDKGWIPRARVPAPSTKDYVVRPKSTVDIEMSKGSSKKPFSRLEKHLKNFKEMKRSLKVQRAVKISIEGRKI